MRKIRRSESRLLILLLLHFIYITKQLCLQSCQSCSSSSLVCLQCISTSYIAIASRPAKGCLPCRPECKTCSSEVSLCSTCAVSYYMDTILYKCLPCQVVNCDICDQYAPNICLTCNSGYFLIQSSGICQNCKIYPNALTCRQSIIMTCQPGYYVSEGQKCLPCAINCQRCTSATFCTVCSDGYFGSNCTMCHFSCQTCIRASACLSCKNGFYPNGSLCSQCNFSANPGCISCDSSGNCIKCLSNYYLDQSRNCITISREIIKGCNSYEQISLSGASQIVCKQCQNGYYIANGSKICFQCSILCSSCFGFYSSSSCKECQPNYGVALTSNVCGFRKTSSLSKNIYLSQWNFPNNYSFFGNIIQKVNSNCPSFKYSQRARVKIGMISGFNIKYLMKLSFSSTKTLNLKVSTYSIYFNNIKIIERSIESNISQFYLQSSVCSQNSSSDTSQYTMTFKGELPSSFSIYNLAPLNTLLTDGLNYVQVTSLSSDLFFAITELIISYTSCHQTCAICTSETQCNICHDKSLYLQQQKCVQLCDQFFYLYSNKCVKLCPQGTYSNQYLSIWACTQCPQQCKLCQSRQECISCSPGFYLYGQSCVSTCPGQYFANNISLRCEPCSAPCFQCSSSKVCNSCKYNFLNHNTCISANDCNFGQFPSLATMSCQKCLLPCQQCQSQNSCKSCAPNIENPKFLYKKNCYQFCPSGYLPNLITYVCDACLPQCLTCKNTIDFCLNCTNGFLLDGHCILSCPGGLFENYTSMQCNFCKSPCLTCKSNSNVCKSCVKDFILHQNLNSCILRSQCLSLNGSFLTSKALNASNISLNTSTASTNSINVSKDSLYYFCSFCPKQCLTCTSQTNCSICSQNYFLFSNKCTLYCPFGYFNNKRLGQCTKCSPSCMTCIQQPTYCTSCSLNMKLNYLNKCQYGCQNKNELYPTCEKCSYPCYQCQNSVTNCSSCVNGYFFNNETNQCLKRCYDGYYCERTAKKCIRCDYSCLSCVGSTANDCTSCPGATFLFLLDNFFKSGYCTRSCPSRYFPLILSIASQICNLCQQPCLQCQQTSTKCLSCVKGVLNVDQCVLQCPVGKYLQKTTNKCINCSNKCLRCFGPNDQQCYSCNSPYYFLDNLQKCVNSCPVGYIASSISLRCQPCQFPCSQCVNQTTKCLKCWQQTNNNSQSLFQKYSYYFYQYQCVENCPSGTFSQGSTCVKCQAPCKQCMQINICLTCLPQKYFLQNNCFDDCPQGYFKDATSMMCHKCQYPCKMCKSQTECLSCIDGIRINNFCSMIQQCPSGQYLQYKETNGLCVKCSSECLQCVERASKCTKCSNSSKILFNANCVDTCVQGYYQSFTSINLTIQNKTIIKIERQCVQCSDECIDCIDDRTCRICEINYHQLNGKCIQVCPPNYFSFNSIISNIDSRICMKCSDQCKTCVNSNTTCLSCNTGYFLYQFQCIIICPLGTYIQFYQQKDLASSNQITGICRQCIFPCQQCNNTITCQHCLNGYYLYKGSCIQQCKKPLVVYTNSSTNDMVCIEKCPQEYQFSLDFKRYYKCSSECQYPYILLVDSQLCLTQCPDVGLSTYIDQNIKCRTFEVEKNRLEITNAVIKAFVDQNYGIKLIIMFNLPISYVVFQQHQNEKQEKLLKIFINNNLLYQQGRDQSGLLGRQLQQMYQSVETYFQIDQKTPNYMSISINPKTLIQSIQPQYITVKFNENSNLLLRNKVNSIPLQLSTFKCAFPKYQPYKNSFQLSNFNVFGKVLTVFLLIIAFFLFIYNWFAKVYQSLHFCQLVFLLSLLEIQYPPNLWLFLQGFKSVHWYFIGNWFVSQDDQYTISKSTPKISAILVDSNFIRICGHAIQIIIVLVFISGICYLSKFLIGCRFQIVSKISQSTYGRYKLIKWSHIHDLVMATSMIFVFGFFAQMHDYSTTSTLQILGILLSYVLIALITVYYIYMGLKLHKIVKMSQEDSRRFCDKKYLFRDNMMSITQSAVHPKQLYLNYLRAIRIVFFGGIIGAFNLSPMLCVGSILTILTVSSVVYLVSKPYPDNFQNLLLGLSDLGTLLALIFICIIHFLTQQGWNAQQYLTYVSTKWILGWISIIFFLITVFLLIAQLLVSIIKGNSSPMKLPAEQANLVRPTQLGAPKKIEVSPKKYFNAWEANGHNTNSTAFQFRLVAKSS